MAETHLITESDYCPILPHLTHSRERLDELHPSLVAPAAVDSEDDNDKEIDPIAIEGARLVRELVDACSTQGRRRRLAS